MCLTPKTIKVKGHDEQFFTFVVPCGKCYECLSAKRAEFVLRCKHELKHSACAYFVTLTYTDENLRYWSLSRSERRQELDRIKLNPRSTYDKFGKFMLDKEHASKFLKDLQKNYKNFTKCNTSLVRATINGEYGAYTHRPHLHALLFFPARITQTELTNIISQIWKRGNVVVANITDARINYVAKHCMKEDCGNELQKKVAPIFMIRSVFRGGIGVGMENDESIKYNFSHNVKHTFNGKFKIGLPRYITKRLHPQSFSNEELKQAQQETIALFLSRCASEGYTPFQVYLDTFQDYDIALSAMVYDYRHHNFNFSYNKSKEYYANKFQKHLFTLKRKQYLTKFNKNNLDVIF